MEYSLKFHINIVSTRPVRKQYLPRELESCEWCFMYKDLEYFDVTAVLKVYKDVEVVTVVCKYVNARFMVDVTIKYATYKNI